MAEGSPPAEQAQTNSTCDCATPTAIAETEITCPNPEAAKPSAPSSPPVATVRKKIKPAFVDDLLVIGRVENVLVSPDDIKLKARIDTGAGISSLHAKDKTEFERDGKDWVRFTLIVSDEESQVLERPIKRFVSIKQHTGEPQRRPVVVMSLTLGPIEEQVEMTLTDRGDYLYPVLIGRNFLRDRAIVDVSRKFRIKPPAS